MFENGYVIRQKTCGRKEFNPKFSLQNHVLRFEYSTKML